MVVRILHLSIIYHFVCDFHTLWALLGSCGSMSGPFGHVDEILTIFGRRDEHLQLRKLDQKTNFMSIKSRPSRPSFGGNFNFEEVEKGTIYSLGLK